MKKLILLILSAFILSCTGQDITDTTETKTIVETSQVFKIEFQNGNLPTSSFTGIWDTHIRSGAYQNDNYNANAVITSGKNNDNTISHAIFFFLIENYIPYDANIISAYLTLSTTAGTSRNPNQYPTGFTMHELKSICYAPTTTWLLSQTGSSWKTAGGDYYSSNIILGIAGFENATIKINPSIVKKWAGNSYYGVIFKSTDETLNSTEGDFNMHSSESSAVSYRPKLTVYYSLP